MSHEVVDASTVGYGGAAVTRREPVKPTAQMPDDFAAYTFGCPVGTWTGRVDHRVWGKGLNLRLYLTDLGTGDRWWLSVFHRQSYRPAQGGPSVADDIATGDRLELVTRHTGIGTPHLVSARLLS